MKEALSKRLILGRLVNKIGKGATTPFLNPLWKWHSPIVCVKSIVLKNMDHEGDQRT